MSSSKYNYDENSDTWPYFALTVASVLVIPGTVSTLSGLFSTTKKSSNSGINAAYKPFNEKHIAQFVRKSQPSKIFNWKTLLLLAGWVSIAMLGKHISEKEFTTSTAIFDPFEILGVDSGATDREIKSHYRKLSIKFHPDKLSPSLTPQEQLDAEAAFVKINKAYKALTDDVTKENFQKYGHPDGPQATSQGIALPKFLIENHGPYLVAGYVALIAVVLPFIVRKWWNTAKSYTKKGLRIETSDMFVEKIFNLKPTVLLTPYVILDWLCDTDEIKEALPKLNKKQLIALFEAHVHRQPVANESEKLLLVSQVPTLINGLVDLAAHFRNTDVSLTALETLRCILQAVPFTDSGKKQLLQLPGVDSAAVTSSNIKTLGKLFTLKEKEQMKALGISDAAQLQNTLEIASKYPIIKLLSAKFVVPGESVVPPGSVSHIVVKVLVKSAKNHVPIKPGTCAEELLEEEESFESLTDPFKMLRKQPVLPESFTPYFPLKDRTNSWVSFLVLQKDSKLVENPETFTNLDLSNLELSETEVVSKVKDKCRGLAVGTFKIKIGSPAPAEPGNYEFRLLLKNADYFGCDLDIPLVMKVEEIPKVSDVSDNLDNSLSAHAVEEYFDSEDEDEIAGVDDLNDLDDGWSDIDTDTEDEEEEEEEKKTK